MPDVHAVLSASSSERWIHCPPSVRMGERFPEEGSDYASEGTDAHALAEYLLRRATGDRDARDPTADLTWYDREMQESAEEYAGVVMELHDAMEDPAVFIEQRVDFAEYVPGGFGTSDCILVGGGRMYVADFKYGKGVRVDAERNSQLMCYALGAYIMFGPLFDVGKVTLVVIQPRIGNCSTWDTSPEELLGWAETVLKPAAEQAFKGEGGFACGEWCRFCRAKAVCRERAEANLALAGYEFRKPPELTDGEIAGILGKAEDLASWASDVREYALRKALAGTRFEGWKLVQGRSVRKYLDEGAAAAAVSAAGYDPYEKKVLGVSAMGKMLGKKKFDEILGSLVVKPEGKPALVRGSDRRPEMETDTARKDFMEENA